MEHFLSQIRAALDAEAAVGEIPPVEENGSTSLPSVFDVSGLASASIGAAAGEIAGLFTESTGTSTDVVVDRRLASLWFGWSIVPDGWAVPPAWDAVAGDYETADGWIKLHTNAPHHREAAMSVLGTGVDRDEVAAAVRGWNAMELESAIAEAGGASAEMRSVAAWAVHPQGVAVADEPVISLESSGLGPVSRPRLDIESLTRTLAGIRVLDLTRVLAGPVATRFMAGFGAEVLRIDPPSWNEDGVVPEVTLGKRCARVDLKTSAGLAVVDELLAGADVIVHGYRSDVLEQLGLGMQRRRELNPAIIDVSLDAYGWTGPWANRRGFDSLVQLSTGIAHAGMIAAGVDRPHSLPVQALDHATGYMLAAAAVRGLRHRRATGQGVGARLSLARTAAMLIGGPVGDLDAAFAPLGGSDVDATVEHTTWGPARRVVAPVQVGGHRPRWTLPAVALGTHEAAWPSVRP